MTTQTRKDLMDATSEMVNTANALKKQAHRLELLAVSVRRELSEIPPIGSPEAPDTPAPQGDGEYTIEQVFPISGDDVGAFKTSKDGSAFIRAGERLMYKFRVADDVGSTFWFSIQKQQSNPLASIFRSKKGVAIRLVDKGGRPLTQWLAKCGASIGEDRRRSVLGRPIRQPTMIVVQPETELFLELKCDIEDQNVGLNYYCTGPK